MINKIKKIAILTSGGDSPCMNKVISTFVIHAYKNNIEPYFVFNGFKGLYDGKIKKALIKSIENIYNLPGTVIKSSRFPEFEKDEIALKAIKNLREKEIDFLIVCGGNGSYLGVQKINKLGFPVAAIPGTIDNDVSSTDFTIGFDSALNNIIQSIMHIKYTSESHNSISIIEIMGRKCPDLAILSSIACDVDFVITKKNFLEQEDFLKKIKELRKINKGGIIILVTEKIYGVDGKPSLKEVMDYISSKINEKIRLNILTFSQRGATPTAIDLCLASLITKSTIKHYLEGFQGFATAIVNNKIKFIDINKAVSMKKNTKIEDLKNK